MRLEDRHEPPPGERLPGRRERGDQLRRDGGRSRPRIRCPRTSPSRSNRRPSPRYRASASSAGSSGAPERQHRAQRRRGVPEVVEPRAPAAGAIDSPPIRQGDAWRGSRPALCSTSLRCQVGILQAEGPDLAAPPMPPSRRAPATRARPGIVGADRSLARPGPRRWRRPPRARRGCRSTRGDRPRRCSPPPPSGAASGTPGRTRRPPPRTAGRPRAGRCRPSHPPGRRRARRIEPRRGQRLGGHHRGGGLAVGAGDRRPPSRRATSSASACFRGTTGHTRAPARAASSGWSAGTAAVTTTARAPSTCAGS